MPYKPKNFDRVTGYNHGNNPIPIDDNGLRVIEARPYEIHVRENGSITNAPSIGIVSLGINPLVVVVNQVSLLMLNEGLKEAGYQITKI